MMKFLTTLAVVICLSAGASSTEASAAWCFGGGWGWGSYHAPSWGGYYGSYRPYYAGSYAVSYGGCSTCGCSPCSCAPCGGCSTCGCSPCSCDPCGCSPCGYSCGSGCGAACGATPSSSDPGPVRDPGFRDGVDSQPRDRERWRNGGDSGSDSGDAGSIEGYEPRDRDPSYEPRDRDPISSDDGDFPRRDRPDFLDNREDDAGATDSESTDDFGPGAAGSDDEFNSLFGGDDEGTIDARKPEQDEPVDDSDASDDNTDAAPTDGLGDGARLFRGVLSERQARTDVSDASTSFRLVGHTSPQERRARSTRWSGHGKKQQPRLHWIGAPARDGRSRL